MRRLLAAIAAVVMVAVGFIVWQARNDSPSKTSGTSSSDVKTIWCVPEAMPACNATKVQNVVELSPADIETAIKAAGTKDDLDTEAIVAPDYWLQRWEKLIAVKAPLAESALVAVQRNATDTKNCKGQLKCLSTFENRLSMPSITKSGTGLLAASLVLQAAGVRAPTDDNDSKATATIATLRKSLLDQSANTMLTNVLTLPLLDAAVMTQADANGDRLTNVVVSPISPKGTVVMSVGTFAGTSLTPLKESLAAALMANGWSAVGGPVGGPAYTYLNDTYEALR